MNARDELAAVLMTDELNDSAYYGRDYALAEADAILAAGYRKPKQVTTTEELDALADGVVILSDEGGVFEHEHGWWRVTGSRDPMASSEIALPATVIHETEES